MRSFDAPGGADEPRAAQAFERPRLSHPHHVLTLRSALIDLAAECYLWTDILNVHRTVEALLNASTWPGYGLQVGREEDAQRTQQKRRMTELLQCSSRPMLSMCSEERDFECPGGLWRPGIRFFSLLACH